MSLMDSSALPALPFAYASNPVVKGLLGTRSPAFSRAATELSSNSHRMSTLHPGYCIPPLVSGAGVKKVAVCPGAASAKGAAEMRLPPAKSRSAIRSELVPITRGRACFNNPNFATSEGGEFCEVLFQLIAIPWSVSRRIDVGACPGHPEFGFIKQSRADV